VLRSRLQAEAQEQKLAALGFPLAVPEVPGYHLSGANASGGELTGTGEQVIAREGTMAAIATPLSFPPPSTMTLVPAATSLKPASAATLARLG
jgi:hypothetical protein